MNYSVMTEREVEIELSTSVSEGLKSFTAHDRLIDNGRNVPEKSYAKIFSNLYVSGITSLLCLCAGIENLEKINQSWLIGVFLIAFLAWLGSFVAQVYTKNKVVGIILQGVSCITVTIMIISILLLPALNIATQA